MALPAFFAANWQNKYEIGDDKENLVAVAGGVSTAETDFDDDTDSVSYLDLLGGTETINKGSSFPFNFEGNRKYRDPGQEYMRDKLTAQDKSCYFRVTEPDGRVLEGPATISKITPFGGDANERMDFKATVTFMGTPQDTKPNEAILPDSVTVSPLDVTVAVGASQTLTPTVLPENAKDKSVMYGIADSTIATVDSAGKIVGVKAGVTTGTVVTVNGKLVRFTVTVTATEG